SPAPGDGKTTVSWNLAAAAASVGSRVLVIEADLRHPTIASRYGVATQAGLAHVLAGLTRLEDAVKTVTVGERRHAERGRRHARSPESTRSNGLRQQTMDVLTAGALPPNPSDLIESERMRQMIRQAETHYDFVVIDTPPTSIVSDAIPLVRAVSGVIVVTRLGKTTRDLAAHLHQQLVNLDAPVLGVVVNAAGGVGGYGYGYGYGYAAYGESESARRWRRKKRPSVPTLDIDSDGTDGD